MKTKAWIILVIPLLAPAAIFRTGQFNWQVVPGNLALSAICWLGWIGALVVGLLLLCGKWPGGRTERSNRNKQ